MSNADADAIAGSLNVAASIASLPLWRLISSN